MFCKPRYLGGCLLWAVAVLGADRVRAVGVEPDREAAARFRASVALNGWGEAVSVVEVRFIGRHCI